MTLNPDPKKYAIRFRRGKPVLVDRQILRWRKERRKRLAKTLLDAHNRAISPDLPLDRATLLKNAQKLFG